MHTREECHFWGALVRVVLNVRHHVCPREEVLVPRTDLSWAVAYTRTQHARRHTASSLAHTVACIHDTSEATGWCSGSRATVVWAGA